MGQSARRILVTGAQGFIGQNLVVRLGELSEFLVVPFVRGHDLNNLCDIVRDVDAVVHLAGENRPDDQSAFETGNVGVTQSICDAIKAEFGRSGRRIPLLFSSSTQAELDNPYGRSKLAAENVVEQLCSDVDNAAVIFRLPGVFGKWSRPNYNSVVATFCHNIARGLPITINDPSTALNLVYIDDVVSAFIEALDSVEPGLVFGQVKPVYSTTLGNLAEQIQAFEKSRTSLITERVGVDFVRALYATYVSYLPNDLFSYTVPQYGDERGVFVEMLKTPDCGQFSFFTAFPGVTRGGHYHHTKSEKFLVIKGDALFRFRHLVTDEVVEVKTSGKVSEIVETIPGWAHDITNVGEDELVVMLWANEIFDRERPDTIASKVSI